MVCGQQEKQAAFDRLNHRRNRMKITDQQAEWLASKGVVLVPAGNNEYRVISPVADISLLSQEGTEQAPKLPGWVLSAAFTSRIEGCDAQFEAIKGIDALIKAVSQEFFGAGWMHAIDLIAFDVALGGLDTRYEIEASRAGSFRPSETLSEIIIGNVDDLGLPELALNAGGWVAWEGWVPMLHWLLGRYTPESVLPQVFAEAGLL